MRRLMLHFRFRLERLRDNAKNLSELARPFNDMLSFEELEPIPILYAKVVVAAGIRIWIVW